MFTALLIGLEAERVFAMCDDGIVHSYDMRLAAAVQSNDRRAESVAKLETGKYLYSCAWDDSGDRRFYELLTGGNLLADYGQREVEEGRLTEAAKWALAHSSTMLIQIKGDTRLTFPVETTIDENARDLKIIARRHRS